MTTPQDEKQEPVPIKPTVITGYQFGDYGNFIGEYQFEKNMDKEDIHMPPRTTLLPPPADLEVDQQSFFNGKSWEIKRLDMPYLPDRELPEETGDAPEDGNVTTPEPDVALDKEPDHGN